MIMMRSRASGGVDGAASNIGDFKNWKDHDAYQPSFKHALRDLTK
jgi:hypothetical protein